MATKPDIRLDGAAALLAAVVLLMGIPWSAALAAREAPDLPSIDREDGVLSPKTVREVQSALVTLGLYSGNIDGRVSGNLTAAIRLYQQQAGLKIDGRISEHLVAHLERALRVSHLLRELDSSRRQSQDAARQALAGHPATRDLVTGGQPEPADPTRDPTPCFDNPTVRCLLAEAFESAKAVAKRDLRDWAFGEILAAQARAGLSAQAMETTRRIQDPRLIMVALRDIATAQARAGRENEALAAAEVIPDSRTQVEALAMIAETQARHGHTQAAQDTAHLLFSMARHLQIPADQVAFATKAAITLHRTGDEKGADAALRLARITADEKIGERGKEAAWRQIAGALADVDQLDAALDAAERVAQRSDRAAVLIAAAQSAIRAGQSGRALELARGIDAERYRVLVLAEIAAAKARTGDWAAANAIMEEAFTDAEAITLPFARSYAISRLVLALSQMAGLMGPEGGSLADRFVRARDAADGVNDPRLRAQVLFELAAQQRRSRQPADAVRTSVERALASVDQIPSAVSRVWVHGNVATLHARSGAETEAWAAFDRGIAEVRKIENSWSRARALAKMAQTLIDLVAPTTAPAEGELTPEQP